MKTIDTILFDLDGTLVGTSPEYRYTIVGKALKELGRDGSEDEVDMFWFGSNRDMIIEERFDVSSKVFWSVYNKYDSIEERALFTAPYNDVHALSTLRKLGYKLGIVTGAPSAIASLEVGMLEADLFDCVVSTHAFDHVNHKPCPSGINECMRSIGSAAQNSIYVGNADEDIEAARNASVVDVLIDRGEHGTLQSAPTHQIDDLLQVESLITEI